jgi:hypothetical protein
MVVVSSSLSRLAMRALQERLTTWLPGKPAPHWRKIRQLQEYTMQILSCVLSQIMGNKERHSSQRYINLGIFTLPHVRTGSHTSTHKWQSEKLVGDWQDITSLISGESRLMWSRLKKTFWWKPSLQRPAEVSGLSSLWLQRNIHAEWKVVLYFSHHETRYFTEAELS